MGRKAVRTGKKQATSVVYTLNVRFVLQLVFCTFLASGSTPAHAQNCDTVGQPGTTTLLKAVSTKSDSTSQELLFCIRYGNPNVIDTRQSDGKLLLRGRYLGQQVISMENMATNKTLDYSYSDVSGDVAHVGEADVVRYKLDTIGANIPSLTVEVAGQGRVSRSISGCQLDAVRLKRTNTPKTGRGMELNIVFAPRLGWVLESSSEVLPLTEPRSPPISKTVTKAIGTVEETARLCADSIR